MAAVLASYGATVIFSAACGLSMMVIEDCIRQGIAKWRAMR